MVDAVIFTKATMKRNNIRLTDVSMLGGLSTGDVEMIKGQGPCLRVHTIVTLSNGWVSLQLVTVAIGSRNFCTFPDS